jgi:hypothetical protein
MIERKSHMPHPPSINPDINDIAYRSKYANAVGTSLLAGITYRIARLAHAGLLDEDESQNLQIALAYVWHALHEGTVVAVRDPGTDMDHLAEADNTYPDGTVVVTQERIEPREKAFARNYLRTVWGNGAVNARLPGTVSRISAPPDGNRWEDGHIALDEVAHLEADIIGDDDDRSGGPVENAQSKGTKLASEGHDD